MIILILHPLSGLFSRSTWVSRYQKGKTSLDLNEVRGDGVLRCSDISWTICTQSAPRSRQITTSTPHYSIFTGRMLFLTPNQQCQSTEGKSTDNNKKTTTNNNYVQKKRCRSRVSGVSPEGGYDGGKDLSKNSLGCFFSWQIPPRDWKWTVKLHVSFQLWLAVSFHKTLFQLYSFSASARYGFMHAIHPVNTDSVCRLWMAVSELIWCSDAMCWRY